MVNGTPRNDLLGQTPFEALIKGLPPATRNELISQNQPQRYLCTNGHDTFRLLLDPQGTFVGVCSECGWSSADDEPRTEVHGAE